MDKTKIPIIGAVITAFLSTLCCLPAFLFIFFGISSGVLTYFTNLGFLRIPLGLLTIVLFIFAFINLRRKISCTCTKKQLFKQYILISIIFIILSLLLFYPEIIPIFMD